MALVQAPATPTYVRNGTGKPRSDNGELAIAQILDRLGIDFLYETFFYPIRVNDAGECTHGFTPDFWLAGTSHVPVCHIEVTWPDKPAANNVRRNGRTIDQVMRSKQHKICTVYRIYGVPTLLLDYRACCALNGNSRLLTELLQELHDIKEERDGFFRPGNHHLRR